MDCKQVTLRTKIFACVNIVIETRHYRCGVEAGTRASGREGDGGGGGGCDPQVFSWL